LGCNLSRRGPRLQLSWVLRAATEVGRRAVIVASVRIGSRPIWGAARLPSPMAAAPGPVIQGQQYRGPKPSRARVNRRAATLRIRIVHHVDVAWPGRVNGLDMPVARRAIYLLIYPRPSP